MAQGRWIVACAVCLSLAVPAAAFAAEKASAKGAAKGPKVTYEDDVRPIFREKCFGCHNTDKKTAGLDLTTYSAMMAGGGSGAVIEVGSSGDSYLFNLCAHKSEPYMPYKAEKLPDNQLAILAKWIDGGALESKGSKAAASKKPKMDFALKGGSHGSSRGTAADARAAQHRTPDSYGPCDRTADGRRQSLVAAGGRPGSKTGPALQHQNARTRSASCRSPKGFPKSSSSAATGSCCWPAAATARRAARSSCGT